MLYVIIFLFLGIALIVYGVREQKTVYSHKHITEAEVVGHQDARSSNLTVTAMNVLASVVKPLVSIELESGIKKVVPLHNQFSRSIFAKFPELDLGGRIMVSYFGDSPKEAFLAQHKLAQKPLASSSALLIGICLTIIGIGLLVVWIFTS